MRKLIVGVLLLALAGCISVPEARQYATELPATWPGHPGNKRLETKWWESFGDPVLNALEDEALSHNADLQLAAARIEEARAQLGFARADQFPEARIGVDASRSRRTEVGAMPVPRDPVSNTYQASLRVSYEADLWGRYRHATEAARAVLLASEFAHEVVRTTLVSDVAQGYFTLRALDAQTLRARETLENRQRVVEILRQRLSVGLISELDLRQAESEMAAMASALAGLMRQTQLQENGLAVLLGRNPRQLVEGAIPRETPLNMLPIAPDVPAGLPSELLSRRPDIRQAEQQLIAARARFAEARAAIFPSLALTAYLGSESRDLSNLFSMPANVWGLTAGLVQTVFNAGRTQAAIQSAASRQEQLLLTYEQTVRLAFREVLDALVSYRQAREQADAEGRRVTALRRTVELATLRYEQGLSNYLEVLDGQRNLYQSEQAWVDARRQQLNASAGLIKALGGGWDPARPARPERDQASG